MYGVVASAPCTVRAYAAYVQARVPEHRNSAVISSDANVVTQVLHTRQKSRASRIPRWKEETVASGIWGVGYSIVALCDVCDELGSRSDVARFEA